MLSQSKNNIDNEWEKFILNESDSETGGDCDDEKNSVENETNCDPVVFRDSGSTPKSTELYISTKSKISYLNKEIDLKTVFWKIKVIPYSLPQNGVVKKQMKFNSLVEEELEDIQENLKNENFYEEQIITNINNPAGRIKFKDIRKISIGISKKDITSYRCKKKSAFYNCFVLILRLKVKNIFKEYHVKIFNTGKMEIPGIQDNSTYMEVLRTVLELLLQIVGDEELNYSKTNETVLINSNFNCGYYICRESLFNILKNKYHIKCIFDPCSYPGIQCKFYYHPTKGLIQDGIQNSKNISEEPRCKSTNKKIKEIEKNNDAEKTVEVSFMIFRTGSILIVGKCNEDVLYNIYDFLKKLLIEEYPNVNQKIKETDVTFLPKEKNKKMRRKTIMVHSLNENVDLLQGK